MMMIMMNRWEMRWGTSRPPATPSLLPSLPRNLLSMDTSICTGGYSNDDDDDEDDNNHDDDNDGYDDDDEEEEEDDGDDDDKKHF